MQCEVVSSRVTTRIGELEPSGTLLLRVVPGDLQRVLDRLHGTGQIAAHPTERADKTTEVIDTEAKLKNLTRFRDSLRGMLSKPSATVKDLVEIQQQLADTQAQPDGETAQRKILANETEKWPSKSPSAWRGRAREAALFQRFGQRCANPAPCLRIA
jgi:hypothetical protein